MADEYVRRYATDGYYGFSNFERGLFAFNERETLTENDNPEFIWPPKSLHNPANNVSTKIQRGYMRMISQGYGNTGVTKSLAKTRLHFQFNPDTIVRSVAARNDIQLWMNMDPVQMTQAIPGDANFSFELLFNREAEVTSGKYKNNGTLKDARTPADLFNPMFSDVTEIGVLADLRVFDQIIGQGINKAMIDSLITNVQKSANNARTAAITAATNNDPLSPASVTVYLDNATKKISKIFVNGSGSGYVAPPDILVDDQTGNGFQATTDFVAVVENGFLKSINFEKVKDKQWTSGIPKLSFVGGGGISGKSASTTSDSQDQIPPQFDAKSASKALNYNVGNSAFLVSLPVRIVFSSLFMVEGYVTSTQVTFNKFTPTMVPTQCSVGVTMQAMYIGFAKEKTYFTNVLTDAYNTKDTGGTQEPINTEAAEATKAVGNRLFDKIEKGGSGAKWWDIPDAKGDDNLGVEAFLGNDGIKTFFIRFRSTKELQDKLEGIKTITEISAQFNVLFTYKGNSSGSVSSVWPPNGDKQPSFSVSGNTNFELEHLMKGKTFDTIIFKQLTWSDDRINASNSFDAPMKNTSTSLWDMECFIFFDITDNTGNTIRADQYFVARYSNKHWGEDFSAVDNGILVSSATYPPVDFTKKLKNLNDVAGGRGL